jgi:hypothetical protein
MSTAGDDIQSSAIGNGSEGAAPMSRAGDDAERSDGEERRR